MADPTKLRAGVTWGAEGVWRWARGRGASDFGVRTVPNAVSIFNGSVLRMAGRLRVRTAIGEGRATAGGDRCHPLIATVLVVYKPSGTLSSSASLRGTEAAWGDGPERVAVTAKPALLIALGAALMLCSCGPLLGKRSSACDAHRHGATLVTRYIVVYGTRAGPEATTTDFACLRPAGERVRLGIDELGSVYGSDATTGRFIAAGTYVAAQSSTGEASLAVCARYSSARNCSPARYWISLVDSKTRRRARVTIYAELPVPALVRFPVTVALSAEGAVAWLENSTVGANVTSRLQLWATALKPRGRSSLAAAPSMLDAGSIDPASLRFDGRTLHWVDDGERHHEKLS